MLIYCSASGCTDLFMNMDASLNLVETVRFFIPTKAAVVKPSSEYATLPL